MARYKQIDRNPRLLPVVLSEQIQPGSFEFALDHLIDHELDLRALVTCPLPPTDGSDRFDRSRIQPVLSLVRPRVCRAPGVPSEGQPPVNRARAPEGG